MWRETDGDVVVLVASTCPSCGRSEFPATQLCPACHSETQVITLGPSGVLHGFTEVLHQPPGALVDVPYTVVLAAFEDSDLAVLGRLDVHAPCATLVIGQMLEVCVTETGAGRTYAFRVGA